MKPIRNFDIETILKKTFKKTKIHPPKTFSNLDVLKPKLRMNSVDERKDRTTLIDFNCITTDKIIEEKLK